MAGPSQKGLGTAVVAPVPPHDSTPQVFIGSRVPGGLFGKRTSKTLYYTLNPGWWYPCTASTLLQHELKYIIRSYTSKGKLFVNSGNFGYAEWSCPFWAVAVLRNAAKQTAPS